MSNINNIEIERKYLVRNDNYKALATQKVHIRQGYLSLGENCSVRVRTWDEQGYLTIKSRVNHVGFSRYEIEKELSLEEAEILLMLCISGKIDKDRWVIPLEDGLVCEVDEFHGDNEGLVMAEVELDSEQREFEKPEFLGEEVTKDKRYYNSYLSMNPYKKWEK